MDVKKRRISSSNQVCASNDFAYKAFEKLNEYRLTNGFLCDFQIRLLGVPETFKAHKTVLATRSPFFGKYFEQPNIPGMIEMKYIEKFAVEQALGFMYTGKISICFGTMKAVLAVAKLLQLNEIFALHYDFLLANLSASNCLSVKFILEKYDCEKVMEEVDNVIMKCLDTVVNDKDFRQIRKRDLIMYVNQTSKTTLIWKAITVWASSDFDNRKDIFPEILASLDLTKFPSHELENMMGNKLVNVSRKNVEIIATEMFRRISLGPKYFNVKIWIFLKSLFKTHGMRDLEIKVLTFAVNNFDQISQTKEFCKIGKDDMIFFIKAIPVNPQTENIMWNTLINWIKVDITRQKSFAELFQLLKIENFSLDFIKKVIKNEPLVAADNDCLKLVIEALCALVTTK